jgi:hypothetical protein
MTMLAEVVDAIIGIGTHRDTREVEIRRDFLPVDHGAGRGAAVDGVSC